jgi:MYXO-CTERM domain-containing protein
MRLLSLLGSAALVVGALLTPSEAEACGGTFCDNGQQAMPVDQTGENIIFVMDGDHVEAHIQIQYDPDTPAERFAWIVPLTAVPDFEVGSQQLFNNTLAGTVPAYGFNTWNEPCGGSGGEDGWCDGDGGEGGSGDDGAKFDLAGDGDGDGPDVIKQETVGAFEITVLQGGTAEEVMQWLGDNGYQQDPAAEPILADYLAEGHLFAAFKLTNGAETEEIHPIMIRYQGMEPCVPIRLTQIAAVDDMDIRVFFFGDHRAAPTNYRHIEINQTTLDWVNLADNYKDVVTQAIDSDMADGHAFVTEYAGDSTVISQGGILGTQWNASAFVDAEAVNVFNLLADQGFVEWCDQDACEWQHALIESLVHKYVPVPDGIDEGDFYSCLECYEGLIDLDAWDGQAFADDMQTRIVDPALHAVEVLDTWPTVTRMYTTMSPHEMTSDPFFHQNPDLPEVMLPPQAQRANYCDGDNVFELPDNHEIILNSSGTWPYLEEMPFEHRIELVPTMGAPQVLVDNSELIDELVTEWNQSQGWDGYKGDNAPVGGCYEDDEGDSGFDTGGGVGSGGGSADGDVGCGCTVGGSQVPGALFAGFGLLGLLLVRRRAE